MVFPGCETQSHATASSSSSTHTAHASSNANINVNSNSKGEQDPHMEDAATTMICIKCIDNIEVFATPVVVSIVEEMVECLIAKSPSVNSLLDDFQLRTISEKFTVKKYLHSRTQFSISASNVHFRFIQV